MNNKTNSIATIVLGIAVVVLFILQFTGKEEKIKSEPTKEVVEENKTEEVSFDAPKSTGNLKIAYVNSCLLYTSPSPRDA